MMPHYFHGVGGVRGVDTPMGSRHDTSARADASTREDATLMITPMRGKRYAYDALTSLSLSRRVLLIERC